MEARAEEEGRGPEELRVEARAEEEGRSPEELRVEARAAEEGRSPEELRVQARVERMRFVGEWRAGREMEEVSRRKKRPTIEPSIAPRTATFAQ